MSNQYLLLEGQVLPTLRTLPDKSYKCIPTSPPYNRNIKYGEGIDDNKPYDEYLAWMHEVAKELKRVLTDDGSIFLNIGPSNKDPWIHMDVAKEFGKAGLVLQNEFTWIKSISIGDKSYGHFKPINSQRYVNNTNEPIFHFTKTGDVPIHRLAIGVPYADKSNLKSRSKKGEVKPDLRCCGKNWYIPYETTQCKKYHPAPFPVELPERCIKLCMGDSKDGRVLDPFVGSGTTLLAAQKLGLQGTGIDISPEFLAFARTALHLDTPETSSG